MDSQVLAGLPRIRILYDFCEYISEFYQEKPDENSEAGVSIYIEGERGRAEYRNTRPRVGDRKMRDRKIRVGSARPLYNRARRTLDT